MKRKQSDDDDDNNNNELAEETKLVSLCVDEDYSMVVEGSTKSLKDCFVGMKVKHLCGYTKAELMTFVEKKRRTRWIGSCLAYYQQPRTVLERIKETENRRFFFRCGFLMVCFCSDLSSLLFVDVLSVCLFDLPIFSFFFFSSPFFFFSVISVFFFAFPSLFLFFFCLLIPQEWKKLLKSIQLGTSSFNSVLFLFFFPSFKQGPNLFAQFSS